MPVLLDRLVHRRFFPLALQIASFLKIPETDGTSRILAHWACFKVVAGVPTLCLIVLVIVIRVPLDMLIGLTLCMYSW